MRAEGSEKIKQMLVEKGIQPSFHRIQVLKYLMENKNHPNVEMIYQALIREIPTLSRTTIYNTLNLLMEKGLVKAFAVEDREMRYDIETHFHAHFRCKVCGQIYDIMGVDLKLPEKEMEGFQLENINLYMTGVCPKCRKSS